jgi:hypothetical protein
MEAATSRQLNRALRPAWNELTLAWLDRSTGDIDNPQAAPVAAMLEGAEERDGDEAEQEQEEELPKEWMCPITGDLMHDPAVTACGHLFDRTAIHQWLSKVDCRSLRVDQLAAALTLTAW